MRWIGLIGGIGVMCAACNDVAVQEQNTGTTLDYGTYETSVNRVFDLNLNGRTCSAGGCHNVNTGAGGSFKIYPAAAVGSAEMLANFYSAKSLANLVNAPESKLLLEPLAGSHSLVGSHTGGDIFLDTNDANYQTLLNWIANPVSR